jgi:aspartate aminotransferase-like enzyme
VSWKKKLFIPGPVDVEEEVLLESAKPLINHRGEEFHELFEDVKRKVKEVLSTKNEVVVLTASGTGAVEALAANFAPGRRALVVNAGEFGSRFAEALRVYGAEVVEVSAELGSAPDLETVVARMDAFKPDVVAFVYNDTSPGVRLSYAQELCREAKARGALVLVDAVSAVGGDELHVDAWGIDALAGASQKCLEAPPGLSFVVLSEEAREKLSKEAKSVYFDLRRYLEYSARSETPFTPAVTLLYAFRRALERILAFGVQKWVSMHAERAAALYRAFEALNLTPFVREEFRSRTVLSFTTPAGVSAVELRRSLSGKFGIEITGGLGKLRERIVRVGLMGYVPLRDLVALVAATGLVLKERGVRVDLERALDEVYKLTARL